MQCTVRHLARADLRSCGLLRSTLQSWRPPIGFYVEILFTPTNLRFSMRVSLDLCETAPHISKHPLPVAIDSCEGSNIGSEWSRKTCVISHTVPSCTQLLHNIPPTTLSSFAFIYTPLVFLKEQLCCFTMELGRAVRS